MPLPRNKSVRAKLLLVVLVTSTLALLISGASMLIYELGNFRNTWVNDLSTQADVLGLAAAPALQFEDPAAAHDYLALLQAKPKITSAAIYTASGALFASYSATGESVTFPQLPDVDGHYVVGNELVLFKRIVAGGEIVGTVGLRANYDLFGRVIDYVGILGAIMVLSLIAAALVSQRLQRTITTPISAVTSVARRVIEHRDYTLRAPKTTNDEIGLLVDAFNDMLNELGRRADVLEQSNRQLERQALERKRAEEALAAGQRRNKTLIDALTQVVWRASREGGFAGEQSGWSDYTGQSRSEYSGLGWRQAFAANARGSLDLAWSRAASTRDTFELEAQLWHAPSEAYRLARLRAVPVLDAGGEVIEWMGAITDVEDQRRAEEELRTLNAELEDRVAARTSALEAANRELESFSYSISHDLRAPLRAISGFSNLLWEDHKEHLDAEAQRKLNIIRGQAERMGTLIDDLLAFSRLGRKSMEPTNLDMAELAHNTFSRLHDRGNGALEFRVGKLPPATADRSLLEQVWTNLLSNAVKFSSRKDKPVVEVGAIVEERENVYFVRDNGAGFDPRYRDKLFGVFQRLHDESEFPGTGVGLALVHRIITRHGGRIWADSQPGDGATFHFSLPREAEPETEHG
jgi:signal transduction histidine kinase/HAMP domain-containing protein